MVFEKGNEEEQFIFNQMVEGDKNAFRFFFEKYYTDLCNLVNFYVHNEVVAEEIVQDIYIYFWEKRENIHIESSFKAYLMSASKNKSLNYLRKEKTKHFILRELTEESVTRYEMPVNVMDAKQIRILIDDAINCLPPRCKRIFLLVNENGMTYKEIANGMGLSVKTVENQIGIALKKLREQLQPWYNDIFLFFLFWWVQ